MTREEAINEIKSWDFLEGKEIEAIHTLIPELRESEDERIRKTLIEALKTSKTVGELKFIFPEPTREECIAYLEKQKEKRDYRKLYEDIAKSKWFKQNYVGKSLGCDEEQNPAQTEEEREYVRSLKALISDFIRDNYKTTDISFYQKIYDWLDGRHIEQKPVEYLSKDKVYAIMSKLTTLSTSNLIPFNSPEYLKIHQITKDVRSLLDYPIEQKPAEWSEEDKEMYARVVRRYTDYEGVIMRTKEESVATKMLDAMAQEEIWLKSLRPSWKPSEQEKGALRTAIHILTEERSFPKAAGHLQAILDAFDGKESRKNWKPSEAQLMALHSVIDDESDTIGNEQLKLLYGQLKKLM